MYKNEEGRRGRVSGWGRGREGKGGKGEKEGYLRGREGRRGEGKGGEGERGRRPGDLIIWPHVMTLYRYIATSCVLALQM